LRDQGPTPHSERRKARTLDDEARIWGRESPPLVGAKTAGQVYAIGMEKGRRKGRKLVL